MSDYPNTENVFVFVVCGSKEHIDTLHFSLKALQKVTTKRIIIITDTTRNESPILHSDVIDVSTPSHFNHHQASIYLKTGIHKFLPSGNLYCYLDTDVVAVNNKVDEIFQHKRGIIAFATDHCKVQKFSPYAVNCSCFEKNKSQRNELKEILLRYNSQLDITDPVLQKKQRKLIEKFETIKANRLNYFFISVRFILALNKFKLDEDTFYLRWKKIWVDGSGNTILFTQPRKLISEIEKNTSWTWDKKNEKWLAPNGDDIDNMICNHLVDNIRQKFGIEVSEKNWQHWNGGVFLFDDHSRGFLESWHEKTMAIFEDKNWKTRDQGTLIATAWEWGLQNEKTIPIEFNFLADYHHPKMKYLGNLSFSLTDKTNLIQPNFVHIYHQWGNQDWAVWSDVADLNQ